MSGNRTLVVRKVVSTLRDAGCSLSEKELEKIIREVYHNGYRMAMKSSRKDYLAHDENQMVLPLGFFY